MIARFLQVWYGELLDSTIPIDASGDSNLRKAAQMVMTLTPHQDGTFTMKQTLDRPVVYLDHWAVRDFSASMHLKTRFINALKNAGGTLMFSQHNLSEFSLLTDYEQAKSAENLLNLMLPNIYVVDFTLAAGFHFEHGAPPDPSAPPEHYLLQSIGEVSVIKGGVLTADRLITDILDHREMLAPHFIALKQKIAGHISALSLEVETYEAAKKYRPVEGQRLKDILFNECLRDVHLNPDANFTPNDAIDLLHAVYAVPVADFVLLDARWVDKIEKASRRLRKFGITGRVAQPFSKKNDGIGRFLSQLESRSK